MNNWTAVSGLCVLTAALAVPAAGQGRGAVTSAYTNLDLDRCRVIRQVEEGASTEWQCPGYRGIPLWVAIGDERYDIDVRGNNGSFESTSMFNQPGSRIEWRLRAGQPIAIIYRLQLFGNDERRRSVLAVETVGQGARKGCLVAWVDGAAPDANVVARQQADRLSGTFRCGRDEPRRIGNPA